MIRSHTRTGSTASWQGSLHHHKFCLLKLPALIQAELRDLHRNQNADEGNEGNTSIVFSMGHARALLNL